MAMSGFAAADGQVQIEMQMMCQTGALARNNEGLASTNPYRGCPGITASVIGLGVMTNCYLATHARYMTTLKPKLCVSPCIGTPDSTKAIERNSAIG